jgi:hypothetical protein
LCPGRGSRHPSSNRRGIRKRLRHSFPRRCRYHRCPTRRCERPLLHLHRSNPDCMCGAQLSLSFLIHIQFTQSEVYYSHAQQLDRHFYLGPQQRPRHVDVFPRFPTELQHQPEVGRVRGSRVAGAAVAGSVSPPFHHASGSLDQDRTVNGSFSIVSLCSVCTSADSICSAESVPTDRRPKVLGGAGIGTSCVHPVTYRGLGSPC